YAATCSYEINGYKRLLIFFDVIKKNIVAVAVGIIRNQVCQLAHERDEPTISTDAVFRAVIEKTKDWRKTSAGRIPRRIYGKQLFGVILYVVEKNVGELV